MDSEMFSLDTNKLTKQNNAYTVKPSELAQFGELLQLTNSTKASKLSDWKFTSMDGSIKSSRNVADQSNSSISKEIFGNSVIANLTQNNHKTNVPKSNSEITAALGRITQTDFITPQIVKETTDDMVLNSETNENIWMKSEAIYTVGIGSKATVIPVKSCARTDATGKICEMSDFTDINNKMTDAVEIMNKMTDTPEINSEMTRDSAINSSTTDNLGIRILITDVTGISSAFTYDTVFDSKTTDVTKIHSEEIEAVGTSNLKNDPTIMNSESIVYPEKRNETNITTIPNGIFNATEIVSEITDNRTIDDKTGYILKQDVCVKSARTSTKTISLKDNASHTFQAKTIIKFQSKIPKVSKKALKKFAKTMEQANEPKQTLYANSEKDIEPKIMLVNSHEMKKCAKKTCDIEKFLDAVDLTNKDMVKKSGILLKKQKLVAEVLSYVHAVQSIFRLSSPTSLCTNYIPSNNRTSVGMSSNGQFYEAGEYILEELKLYQSELKSDFQEWEACRVKILDISESMPYDFELCENNKSVRIMMHEFTTEICDILKSMEIISSKSQKKNEECIDLMDGIDTYIKYSSAFIMGENTLTIL